jgi:hypothetical protein
MRATATKESLVELAKVSEILAEGGYKPIGIIKENFISCSSHIKMHQFRGVEIYFCRGDIENYSMGNINQMNVFAYYNGSCYRLIYSYPASETK